MQAKLLKTIKSSSKKKFFDDTRRFNADDPKISGATMICSDADTTARAPPLCRQPIDVWKTINYYWLQHIKIRSHLPDCCAIASWYKNQRLDIVLTSLSSRF